MGNASSISHAGDNLLSRLCGGNSIQYEDDSFWLDLFRAFDKPMLNINPAQVENQLATYCESLLVNNPMTHHFQMLVLHTVSLLGDACQGRARIIAANALHLVWTVIKVAGDSGNGASLLNSLFEMTPSLPIPEQLIEPGSHQLLRLLVRKCLSALVTIRPRNYGWLVIQEIQHTLLVILAATQLRPYHRHTCRGPPGSHPGLEALYSCQQLSPAVVSALLNFIIQRPAPPPECMHLCTSVRQRQGGVVATASAMLWLPIAAVNSVVGSVISAATSSTSDPAATTQGPGSCLSPGTALSPSPVADTAFLLLLLLVHAPDQQQAFNPYRWALKGLENVPSEEQASSAAAAESREGTPDPEDSNPATVKDPTTASTGVCYEALYRALARALSAPSIALPEQQPSSPQAASAVADSESKNATPASVSREDAVTLNIGSSSSRDMQGTASGGSRVDAAAVAAEAGLVSTGCEEAVLLLYNCIHLCQGFKDFVINHSQPGVLLGPLCRALYLLTPSRQPKLLFMLQVLLLMLSQEEVWAKRIHNYQVQHGVAWAAKEYLGKGVTYGSLVLVVLLKTITTTWSGSGSRGLVAPANALAALANMAPHISRCHARAAQRLVNLVSALTKRFSRLGGLQSLQTSVASAAGQGGTAIEPATSSEIKAQLSVLEDYIRLLLEVILLALKGTQHVRTTIIATGHLASNVELLYAVLQQQQVLDTLADQPRLTDLVEQVQAYVRFFNQRLDDSHQQPLQTRTSKGSKHSEPLLPVTIVVAQDRTSTTTTSQSLSSWSTCNQVLDVLLASLPDWLAHYSHSQAARHAHIPELKFIYEEETEPDTFFIPATWELILLRIGSIVWTEPTADDTVGQDALGDALSPAHVDLSSQQQRTQSAGGARVSTSPGASPAKQIA